MSTTNPGDRSAAEIEREVERTRASLTGTVEELKERVSPSQVAEQAMDWLRSSGGRRFAGNLGATVRDNPMPVLLIAAGIGWLAMSGRDDGSANLTRRRRAYAGTGAVGAYPGGDFPEDYDYAGESYPADTYIGTGEAGTHHRSISERASETAGGLRDRAGDLAGKAGETASGVRHRAEDLASRAGGAASGAWDSASGAARSAANSATAAGRGAARRAGEAWDAAADTAGDIGYRARRLGRSTGRGIADAVESQPLLLGAVGFALGAALGGLIPSSEAEDRMLGERRDRLANRLSDMAGDAYAQARDAAMEQADRAGENLGEAYERSRDRMGGGDVSPHKGAAALGGVARDLREAVERTAHEAAGAAREAMGKPEGDSGKGSPTPGAGSGTAGTGTGTSGTAGTAGGASGGTAGTGGLGNASARSGTPSTGASDPRKPGAPL